jgi:hypothetical protein
MTGSRTDERAMVKGRVRWALLNVRSTFAWKCADAADAALRLAQRIEPDIDAQAGSRLGNR